MPFSVTFRRGEVDVAVARLPHQPLPFDPPRGTRFDVGATGATRLVLGPAPGVATDDFCGRVLIPYVRRRTFEHVALDVPPPAPWTWGDVRAMWRASRRLYARHGGLMGHAPWASGEELLTASFRWDAIRGAVRAARSLLASWPVRDDTYEAWLPVEVPGGWEDGLATERALGGPAAPVALVGARPRGLRSARRFGTQTAETSGTLAILSNAILQEIERLAKLWERAALAAEGDVLKDVGGLFDAVRRSAAPPVPVPDPPFSTWPIAFQRYFVAAERLFRELRQTERGVDWMPLTSVWRLYEDWLTERLLGILTRLLGPTRSPRSGSCIASWNLPNHLVELHAKPSFRYDKSLAPSDGGAAAKIAGEWYVGVVGSSLVPDAVLGVRTRATTRLLAVDAKDWSDPDGASLAGEAAKYLWGIRRAAAREQTPVIEHVVLVNPSIRASQRVSAVAGVKPVSPIGHQQLGRASSITAAPYGARDVAGERVQDLDASVVGTWLAYLGWSP